MRAPPPLRVASSSSAPARTLREATAQHGAEQLQLPFPPCWARGVYGASAAAAAAAATATAAAAGCCLYGEEEEEERELSDTSTQIKDKVFYETNLQSNIIF